MTIHHILARIAAVAVGITAAITAPPAYADTSSLQQQVDAYMSAHPGGRQISSTAISYGNGRFIVTLGLPAPHNTLDNGPVADCPSGWFCFYDQPDYTGRRGQLSDCGWQDLAWWDWNDRTVSAYYNMSRGYVQFLNHAAGTTSHTKDTILFTLTTTARGLRLVPTPKAADHVNRVC